jgi:hypothetical protein
MAGLFVPFAIRLFDMVSAMRRNLLIGFMAVTFLYAQAPNVPKGELLWANGAPGALGSEDADKPTLAPYIVPAGRGTGAAVIV